MASVYIYIAKQNKNVLPGIKLSCFIAGVMFTLFGVVYLVCVSGTGIAVDEVLPLLYLYVLILETIRPQTILHVHVTAV